jgi:hypothetical protein
MHALKPGARTLAAVAVSLLGIVKAAEAAPSDVATKTAPAPEASANLLVNVADYYTYRERRVVVREYDDEYDADYDDDYDRPYGYVYSEHYHDYDDDYDPHVHYDGGVHVRAPFVDVYVP